MKPSVAILAPHPKIRPLLCQLLSNLGYRVQFDAGVFDEFVALISPERLPDVCIIDTNYRDMLGFGYSQWIKNNYPAVKTIIYSNDLDDSKFHRFNYDEVADHYVDKSGNIELLQRAIDSCREKDNGP